MHRMQRLSPGPPRDLQLRKAGGSDEGETREGATGHTAASRTPLLHSRKAQGMLREVPQPTEASATASDINHHREHRLEQGGCG